MSGVEIRVRANAKQAQNEIRKTGRTLKGLETQAANITKTFQRMAIGLTSVFAGVGITKGINRAADAMTSLNNRVNLVTRDVNKTKDTVKKLFDVAARSGGSIDAAAETFNRFGLALRDSNKPIEELLKVTEAVQKAAVISGSGAESAKAAIVQLGQGLASGQLRGQELNSVLEQMPRLAQAIAEGMKIPFGKLREEAMAGKITADAVYAALLSGAEKINEEFKTLEFTTGEFATVMKNELMRAISEFDKVAGFSDAFKNKLILLTQGFRFLGENIARWGLITKLTFLMAQSDVKDFFHTVKGLFTGKIDAAAFANSAIDSIINTFSTAKTRVKNAFFKLFSEESVDAFGKKIHIMPRFKFSTAGMFSGINAAVSAFNTFKDNVIEIFEVLHGRLFGNTLYTGMFYDGHKEPQQKMSFGSNIWPILNKSVGYFRSFKNAIIGFFVTLHTSVTKGWDSLVNYFNDNKADPTVLDSKIKDNFDSLVQYIKNKWDGLGLYLGKFKTQNTRADGLGADVTFGDNLEVEFSSIVGRMEKRWEGFLARLKPRNTRSDGMGANLSFSDNVRTEFSDELTAIEGRYDSFLGIFKDRKGAAGETITFGDKLSTKWDSLFSSLGQTYDTFIAGLSDETKAKFPTFAKIQSNFNAVMTTMKDAYTALKAAFLASPVVVLISSTANKIGLNYEAIKKSIDDFFIDNQAGLNFAVSAGLALIFSPITFKGAIRKGLIGGFGLMAALSMDDPEFRDSVKATAEGWGKAFKALVSDGEGSFIADVTSGIFEILKLAGEGLALGFFGDKFEGTLRDGLTTSLVAVAAAFLITPKLARGLARVGGLILGGILGKKATKKAAATGIQAAIAGTATTAGWGVRVGTSLARSVVLTQTVAAAILSPIGLIIAGGIAAGILAYNITDDIAAWLRGISVEDRTLEIDLKAQVIADFEEDKTITRNPNTGAMNRPFDRTERKLIDDEVKRRQSFHADITRQLLTERNKINVSAADRELALIQLREEHNTKLFRDQDAIMRRAEKLAKIRQAHEVGVGVAMASGGAVHGPGSGTSDSVPALLSNGEFVIKTSAVEKIGKRNLELLNQGIMPRFKHGGFHGTGGTDFALNNQNKGGQIASAQERISNSVRRGDVALARQIIATVTALGKLDEVVESLNEEIKEVVVAEVKNIGNEDRKEGIDELKKNFNSALATSISRVLHGGDWRDVMTDLLDTVTSTIINNFAAGLADGLMEKFDFGSLFDFNKGTGEAGEQVGGAIAGGVGKIFGGNKDESETKTTDTGEDATGVLGGIFEKAKGWMSGIFGEGGTLSGVFDSFSGGFGDLLGGIGNSIMGLFGGGGKMDIGALFMKGLSFFGSQGGTVPSTPFSQAGKDSVPSMLMPGEVVLSKNAVANSQASTTTQNFSINVTGDVSRQTRKEIAKMMPQIAGGVNAQNKERGIR